MFKTIFLYLVMIGSLTLSFFMSFDICRAGVVDISGDSEIKKVSLEKKSGTLVDNINETGFSLLSSIKTILIGVFLFYIVYAGAKMIMSMGTDDAKISSAKRQIWYGVIGIIFINIPGTIYNAFFKETQGGNSTTTNWSGSGISSIVGDGFESLFKFIVGLLEILIFFIALFIFIYTGLKLIIGGKDSKTVNEAKLKILYSIVALVLVGFIEVWKEFAFGADFAVGYGIFRTIANLLLYIAPLIGLFFLTLAGYYYITSGGDKEKVKKSKDIIIYILLGTLIFLASYTILIELNTFIN
ncbi:hypothetical protein EOM39_00490 [Candidatus Gracilibacteria bacterium]|nr:hypothetical protein [Candidatus Gracilibacteria bacterium]